MWLSKYAQPKTSWLEKVSNFAPSSFWLLFYFVLWHFFVLCSLQAAFPMWIGTYQPRMHVTVLLALVTSSTWLTLMKNRLSKLKNQSSYWILQTFTTTRVFNPSSSNFAWTFFLLFFLLFWKKYFLLNNIKCIFKPVQFCLTFFLCGAILDTGNLQNKVLKFHFLPSFSIIKKKNWKKKILYYLCRPVRHSGISHGVFPENVCLW